MLALLIAQTSTFAPYALGTELFVSVMIFTHTFASGRLAALDPSGRAVAATPAMLMIGAAIGPVLGGTLVEIGGYGNLGIAAVIIAACAVVSFWRLRPSQEMVVIDGRDADLSCAAHRVSPPAGELLYRAPDTVGSAHVLDARLSSAT